MMRADASRYPTVLGRCTLSLSSELLPPARSPRPPPPFCTLVPFWWRPASPFCPAIFARIQLSGAALDINSSHHSHGQKREGHCILLVLLHCAKKTVTGEPHTLGLSGNVSFPRFIIPYLVRESEGRERAKKRVFSALPAMARRGTVAPTNATRTRCHYAMRLL